MIQSQDVPTEDIGHFSKLYRQIVGSRRSVAETLAEEGTAVQRKVREKLVRCLWFEQFLDTDALQTEDGRKLTVYSPGYWNEGAGPDFLNAEFSLEHGPRIRGDVEIHVAASDWQRHGHENDPAYRRVALHVVLRNDLAQADVFHAAGKIPQVALERFLSQDLEEVVESLDLESYVRTGTGDEGPCSRSIRTFGRDETWVGRFLDIAGDERMLGKAERFAEITRNATPDEAMYAGLMECMGYSRNRRGFKLVARGAPLAQLRRLVPVDADVREKRAVIEAILFGVAGFFDVPTTDGESVEYLSGLRRRWQTAAPELPAPLLDRSTWTFRQTRPVNHPCRRLAAVSVFLGSCLHTGLCRAMLTVVEQTPTEGTSAGAFRKILERFCKLFDPAPEAYWSHRAVFGPPRLKRASRLLGPARATETIVNLVIPLLLSLADSQNDERTEMLLHHIFCSLRPVPDTSVTKYMKARIFNDAARRRGTDMVVRRLRRQQGLLQIFHDFCESTATTCESCGFLAAVEGRTA